MKPGALSAVSILLVVFIIGAMPAGARKHQPNPADLISQHTSHVEQDVLAVLDTLNLSRAQIEATRDGLEAFAAARAAGSADGVTSPDSSGQEDGEMMGAGSQMPSVVGQESEAPELTEQLNSIGAVVCTVGDQLLVNGRFVLSVTYQDYLGNIGIAFSCRMSNSAGYFFYSDKSNIEIPVKVVEACAWGTPPGHWVFAAGLTTYGVQLTVFDVFTGLAKTYTNPLGHTFNTILDQSAPFPCP